MTRAVAILRAFLCALLLPSLALGSGPQRGHAVPSSASHKPQSFSGSSQLSAILPSARSFLPKAGSEHGSGRIAAPGAKRGGSERGPKRDFGARSYDARQGQWLSPDPILAQMMVSSGIRGVSAPQNLWLYSYVRNNPGNLRDMSGRSWWSKAAKVGWKVIQ